MYDSLKRLELIAEIAALRKRQQDASRRATFLGWTPQTTAEHDQLSKVISTLFTQLATFSGD
jgi:hypothetical protein